MDGWLVALGWRPTETPLALIGARLIVAAALSAVIGIEREAHDSDAGLRTHVLIGVAAALFTALVFEIYASVGGAGSGNADPIRAVEAITAGVAFLGAGAIFREKDRVKGLTTGAGMWLAGAIGMACALGHYGIAAVAAALGFVVLKVFKAILRGTGP